MADTGLILKGVGGFYTVLSDNGTEIVCRARGRFRKDGITGKNKIRDCGKHL